MINMKYKVNKFVQINDKKKIVFSKNDFFYFFSMLLSLFFVTL